MINMTLKHILQSVNGQLYIDVNHQQLNTLIDVVAIDSRMNLKNGLFVAFNGEHVNGHDYLSAAQKNGAIAALVETVQENQKIIQIKVENCLKALTELARICRIEFTKPVIGITGSCGKTTVKEMLNSIIAVSSNASVTQGNQNNEIGVPLTLCALEADDDYAIIEMGAAQQGDISYLMSMVTPDVSVITNVRAAHVGRFGSEDFIAVGKSEIYRDLKSGKTAIVNLDEKYAQQWLDDLRQQRVLSFSVKDRTADLFADDIQLLLEQSEFTLHYQGQVQTVVIYAPGLHNVHNALAAAACAIAVNVKFEDITIGLMAFGGVVSRLQQLQGFWGGRLIDDCYNANPGSVKAAIDVLKEYPQKKTLILGDMAELGDESIQCHQKIGHYAYGQGVDRLFSLGKDSRFAAEAFGAASKHFTDKKELLAFLINELDVSDVVLVKGSRSIAMEELIQPLLYQEQGK